MLLRVRLLKFGLERLVQCKYSLLLLLLLLIDVLMSTTSPH